MNKIGSVVFMLALASFILCATHKVAKAQDPSPAPAPAAAPPTAQELRLQEENRLLGLEKTNAGLKKDIRESQPKPSATPLEGETTVDENVVIETQMVTYKAMSDIADRIGAEIHQKFEAKAIAIYDADEIENLKHYRATSPILKGRIQSLKEQYKSVQRSLAAIPPLTIPKTISDERAFTESQWHAARASELSSVEKSNSLMIAPNAPFPLIPIPLVTEGLKVFADLLALIRTDTDIKGKPVSVEESALVAETFRALRNRFGTSVSLYYPKVVSPEVNLQSCKDDKSVTVFCSPTLNSLADLYVEKEKADEKLLRDMFDVTAQFEKASRQKGQAEGNITALGKQIADLKLDQLRAELEKPWNPAKRARFQKYLKEIETMKADAVSAKATAESQLDHFAKRKNVLEQLQGLNHQADQLVATLVKADEKTGGSELANFMRAENIDQALGSDGYWLAFRSITAGGNNRTRKNLFRYFSGAKLDHSGGLVVEWALYNRNGVSVDSNKDSSYGGYVAPKEIQSAQFKDKVADPKPQGDQSRVLASSKNH